MKEGKRRLSHLTFEIKYEPDIMCEVRAVMIALGYADFSVTI